MCGITGIYAFNLVGKFNKVNVTAATMALEKRGPDFQDIYIDEWVGLGHRRLSIIDTSEAGNQPMWDDSGRYCIVFNGEIFNYRELRQSLESAGVSFSSQSDSEVLLKLYIKEKEKALSMLRGFFAFCIYDKTEQTLFLARDQYGIKPLLYLIDEDKFIFASEMKSLLHYGIEKDLDFSSLYTYLQLNYIPAPFSIFKNVHKVLPGHYLKISYQKVEEDTYYEIPSFSDGNEFSLSYDAAQSKFSELLEKSVQQQLISDVPLGAFLSGGIDSSVITALAKRHKPDLQTFSIGYRDEKFFDETEYASLVAKHLNTEHTVFSLSNEDLLQHLDNILKYIDEPFADSSAIAVYILSKETRKHATVALSGDGADELLGGYSKHAAFYRSFTKGWKENLVGALDPLWQGLPGSRNTPLGNKVRQMARFSEGLKLPIKERYWRWAGFVKESAAFQLLNESSREKVEQDEYHRRKGDLLSSIKDFDINSILTTDTKLVLPNDMLAKVDMMSMAHGLEVRPPFLNVELVNFIVSLPAHYKITRSIRKKILQDAFRNVLPEKLYNRPKKGFEVPLLKWFRKELKSRIMDDLLNDGLIKEQGIFDPQMIKRLKKQLFSSQPGDIHARIWALIVFQFWWKSHFQS